MPMAATVRDIRGFMMLFHYGPGTGGTVNERFLTTAAAVLFRGISDKSAKPAVEPQ